MNKELEKYIEVYKQIKKNKGIISGIDRDFFYSFSDTMLDYIENSIPKQTLIEKIRERQFELQQEYKEFKDDIKLNTLQDLLEGVENK